jgi:hypothetical protein
VIKKLAAPLAATAVVALALTGCSNDDSDAKAKSWAGKVCDKIQPQLKNIQEANSEITDVATEKDPQKVKDTDSKAFDRIAKAYAAMGDAVQSAGAPPIDDGKSTNTNAVKEMRDTSKAYGDLKRTVDQMDASDQGKFADGLKSVASQLGKLDKSGGRALGKLQSGKLGQAMSEQAGCQKTASEPSKAA